MFLAHPPVERNYYETHALGSDERELSVVRFVVLPLGSIHVAGCLKAGPRTVGTSMKDERRWQEWITLVGFVVMSVGISGTFRGLSGVAGVGRWCSGAG